MFRGTILAFPLAIRWLLCWVNPICHHSQFLGGVRRKAKRGLPPISVPPHVFAPWQWDLVCSSRSLKQLAQSLYMTGILVGGIIFGGLSDR